MRPFRTLTLTVLLGGLALAVALPRTTVGYQHIANGGFEAGAHGWSTDSATTLSVDAASARMGGAGAHLSGNSTVRVNTALPQVLGAGRYELAAWVRPPVDSQVTLRMSSGEWGQVESSTMVEAAAWTDVRASFNIPAASIVSISIIVRADTADIDEVRLDGAAPVTMTPTATHTAAAMATQSAVVGTPEPTVTTSPTPTPVLDVIASHVRNPGFEELDGNGLPFAWDSYGGTLASTSHARGGVRGARLSSGTDSTKWVHQAVLVDGGAWYAMNAHVTVVDAGVEAAFLRISWYASGDGSGSALATVDSTSRLTAPGGYQTLTTGPVQAPPEARSARLRIMLAPWSAAAAAIEVDDVAFAPSAPLPVSEATPTPAVLPGDEGSDRSDAANTAGRTRSRARSSGGAGVSQMLATGAPSDAAIVINEVLYDATGDVADADAEWVELYNASDVAVDVAGWALGDGATHDVLPTIILPARGFVVIAASTAFFDAYPEFRGSAAVLGTRIGNGLGNDGDALYLYDPAGRPIDAVSWGKNAFALNPAVADVPEGHSIERGVPGVDTDSADDWIDNERPSPGAAYAPPFGAPATTGAKVTILDEANAGAWEWIPWALAASSMAALVGAISWRAIEVVRARPRQEP